MRAMSFYLADLALRASERSERSDPSIPEPAEAGPFWTPERAAAWRAWASRDAGAERAPVITARTGLPRRIEAPSRRAVVETARVIRQPKFGGWFQLFRRTIPAWPSRRGARSSSAATASLSGSTPPSRRRQLAARG
jgi:hypothetical protein